MNLIKLFSWDNSFMMVINSTPFFFRIKFKTTRSQYRLFLHIEDISTCVIFIG
ncbi:hypothetical protein UUR2_0517 [Ureaplasma urealyticum serovar 2 str. ATCC 27814]|nr:hypothetical protein UUR2_0517 [Ureaplasma urealyticum serovar 2 str. ATCC 27814]